MPICLTTDQQRERGSLQVFLGITPSPLCGYCAITPPALRVGLHLPLQGQWLARLANGLDGEEVKPRLLPKSVGCSKTFRGRSALTTLEVVHQWLKSIGALSTTL